MALASFSYFDQSHDSTIDCSSAMIEVKETEKEKNKTPRFTHDYPHHVLIDRSMLGTHESPQNGLSRGTSCDAS